MIRSANSHFYFHRRLRILNGLHNVFDLKLTVSFRRSQTLTEQHLYELNNIIGLNTFFCPLVSDLTGWYLSIFPTFCQDFLPLARNQILHVCKKVVLERVKLENFPIFPFNCHLSKCHRRSHMSCFEILPRLLSDNNLVQHWNITNQ